MGNVFGTPKPKANAVVASGTGASSPQMTGPFPMDPEKTYGEFDTQTVKGGGRRRN